MLVFIIIIISFIAQSFLPWWIIVPVCLFSAFIFGKSKLNAFLSGFLGIFILWAGKILFLSLPNEHLLANRVSQVFMIPDNDSNWVIMLLISSIIGGIIGGLSSLAGKKLQKAK